jgi:hypothetical protein
MSELDKEEDIVDFNEDVQDDGIAADDHPNDDSNNNEDIEHKIADINNLSKELAIKQVAKTKIEILIEAKKHYDVKKKVEMSMNILQIYKYHYSRHYENLKRKTELYEEISAMQIAKKYYDKLILEEKAVNIIKSYN